MSIRISNTPGLNPSVGLCYLCQEPKEVVLFGQLTSTAVRHFEESGIPIVDGEAPHKATYDKEPCSKCRELMEQGIILISVRDEEPSDNPYRTGGWVVVREEALRRVLHDTPDTAAILSARVAFLPDPVWEALGLPRGTNETTTANTPPTDG